MFERICDFSDLGTVICEDTPFLLWLLILTAVKINNQSKNWVTFTYHRAKVRKITNLFKHTDTKIAFKSTNTIHQQTGPKNLHITQDYDKSGIYRLTCKTSDKAYVGQTRKSGHKIPRTRSLHKK
jgi:hypothetical protein